MKKYVQNKQSMAGMVKKRYENNLKFYVSLTKKSKNSITNPWSLYIYS